MGVEPGFSNLGCFWVCVLGAAGKRRAGSGGGGMCNFWRVEFVVVTFVDQYLLLLRSQAPNPSIFSVPPATSLSAPFAIRMVKGFTYWSGTPGFLL